MIHKGRPYIRQGYPVWLDPLKFSSFFLLPIYFYAGMQDLSIYNIENYTGTTYYYYGLLLIFLIILGTLVGSRLHRSQTVPLVDGIVHCREDWLIATFFLFFLLSLVGYVVWFRQILEHPYLLINTLGGGASNVRGEISTIPGITTLTQFGPLVAVLYPIVIRLRPHNKRTYKAVFVVLLICSIVRAVSWGERVALIELVFPFLVVEARLSVRDGKQALLYKHLGLIILPAAIFIFSVSEYFRSWNFYQTQYDSYARFVIDRLTAYYTVSINNGIGFLDVNSGWPFFDGRYVFAFWHALPFFDVGSNISNSGISYANFLENFARSDLNNMTALFAVTADIGAVLALIAYVAYGIALGYGFYLYRMGALGGLVCYPLMLYSLYEIFRYSYFSNSRATYLLVGLLWIVCVSKRRKVI